MAHLAPFRGYILTLAACIAVEAGIFYGLGALGSSGELIVAIELIWLCVTVVVTILIGDHFDPEAEERGKASGSG